MSSMRNAVQRRNHKERAQPLERQKWGLLEKHKVRLSLSLSHTNNWIFLSRIHIQIFYKRQKPHSRIHIRNILQKRKKTPLTRKKK